MCCLKYENDIYMEMRKGMPDVGEKIKTPDGLARVVDTNLLENKIKVRLFVDEKEAKPHGRGKQREEEHQHGEAEKKLSTDIYVYKKEEIKRIERRKDRNKENLFEGVDADTMKEIEKMIKD